MRVPITLSLDEEMVKGLKLRGYGNMSAFIETALAFYINQKEHVEVCRDLLSRAYVQCLECPATYSLVNMKCCPSCSGMKVMLLGDVDSV